MKTSIEITIPILNEESTLYDQIFKVNNYIGQSLQDIGSINIVLADNGSTDRTPEIGRLLAQEFGHVRYLRLDERGVGRALKASWCTSTADIVGYMDLDLATDMRHLRPAFELLISNRQDIVTGSRLAKGAQVIGRSFVRNLTSRAFNLIVKFVFRTSFSDGMCGFKFLKRTHLQSLLDEGAVSDGWFFATEILVVGENLGLRVGDLPVKWTDDANSKVKIGKLTKEYLLAMFVLRKRLRGKSPRC